MKKTILLVLAAFSLFVLPASVAAITIPSFPSCLSPAGTLKDQFNNGIHGIVGDSRTYTGSDSVFFVGNNNLMQCFCADNGEGIQTNWINANNISNTDVKSYESRGWILVPNGADWGLDSVPYLAKNSAFTCGANVPNNLGKGGGEVMGLANTGNMRFILALLSLGVVSAISGFLLKKVDQK